MIVILLLHRTLQAPVICIHSNIIKCYCSEKLNLLISKIPMRLPTSWSLSNIGLFFVFFNGCNMKWIWAIFVKSRFLMAWFSIVIQIRWKFGLGVIPWQGSISLQKFAHDTTAQLSCHVQNFVAITSPQLRWEQMKLPSNSNYDGKIIRGMGPLFVHVTSRSALA